MADLVANVLREAQEKKSSFKSIEVHKSLELELDEGNLLATDPNPIDQKCLR